MSGRESSLSRRAAFAVCSFCRLGHVIPWRKDPLNVKGVANRWETDGKLAVSSSGSFVLYAEEPLRSSKNQPEFLSPESCVSIFISSFRLGIELALSLGKVHKLRIACAMRIRRHVQS